MRLVSDTPRVLCLQPPSPPGRNVLRDYAGGFGVSLPQAPDAHRFTQPNLPLVYAATALRNAGHPTRFMDTDALGLSASQSRDSILADAPDVIVATLNLPSLTSDLAQLAELKASTGAAVIALGTVCRPPELLADILSEKAIDYAITGDAEVAVAALVERLGGAGARRVPGTAWRAADGTIERLEGGTLDDLEALPTPAYGLLPMSAYTTWEFGRAHRAFGREFGAYQRYFPLYLSRGCPYGCPYCPYPVGVGKRWMRKSPDQVIEEMAGVVASGTTNILLRDQTVGEDNPYLEAVCERMIAERLDVHWLCEARPGSLPASLMPLMRRAGCVRIHYGVETGDAEMFATQAKRGIAADVVDRCLRDTEAAGILPSLHFLVGFPQDTWRSVSATLALIERCGVRSGDCSLMTPYPGTRHYDQMRDEGRILATSWDEFTGADPVELVEGLSPVELVTARWRILSAIEANRRRTLRQRMRDASRGFRQGFSAAQAGPPIDEAIDRTTRDAVGTMSAHPLAEGRPA